MSLASFFPFLDHSGRRTDERYQRQQTTKPLIDLLLLSVVPKVVAPLATQAPSETRKVWAEVTNHLLAKEYSAATKSKQAIEQVQREKAEARKIQGEM